MWSFLQIIDFYIEYTVELIRNIVFVYLNVQWLFVFVKYLNINFNDFILHDFFIQPFLVSNETGGTLLPQIYIEIPVAYASKSFSFGAKSKAKILKELTNIYLAIKHFK